MKPRFVALICGVVAIGLVVNLTVAFAAMRLLFHGAAPANRNANFAFVQQRPMAVEVGDVDDFIAAPDNVGQPLAKEALPQTRGAVVETSAYQVTGPFTHANLSVYLIHGKDTMPGQKVITLEEALNANLAVVHEGGISIDNRSDLPVFIQGGDIIKGGNQDRVLPYDYLIPAGAKRSMLTAFCVEQGRSFPRAGEISASFQVSSEQLPTRALKLAAMRQRSQNAVWSGVSQTQTKLGKNVGAPVQADLSRTSLQLTLEHPRVQEAAVNYMQALLPALEKKDNVIGFAVAVNGQISSADVYASADLFQRLWPKLVRASAVEAIAERGERTATNAPNVEAVQAFLVDPESGQSSRQTVAGQTQLIRHESNRAVMFETCDSRQGNLVVHRCFLAK